jgi:hypothetical protein
MGVAWGIVEYATDRERDKVIADWRDLALDSDEVAGGFTIMHGTDRIRFEREEIADNRFEPRVTVVPDPEARARVDALRTGDGSYDMFERMFDGHELFVPWDMHQKVNRPGSAADTLLAACVWDLRRKMAARVRDFTPGTDLHRLASELGAAAELATELNMLIRISF